MSPSESDLRAALRDGEGDDRPDVERLVTLVRDRRGQRRARMLGVAATVLVVGAAAVGTAVWRGSDGGGQQAVGTPTTSRPAIGSSSGPSTGPSAAASAAASGADCPSTYPTRALPAVGGGSGPMFSAAIASAVVCSYDEVGSTAATTGSRLVLTGSDATSLAGSIEHASSARLKIMCPDIRSADRKLLAIIGITADGQVLPTVTTDVSIPNCNEPITNGTAVRYAWKPPTALAARINALR